MPSAENALRYDGQSDDPDEVAGVLNAMMPSGVKVLDCGCGTGSITLIANRGKGNDVHAIEPNAERAGTAASRGLKVTNGFLDADFAAAHGPFDVVMSSDVLEHTVDPAAVLDDFRKALKPGGLLLISVPNVAHWSVRANLLRGRFRYEEYGIMDATHLRWFTRETLLTLLERAGFTPEAVRVTAGFNLTCYEFGNLSHLPWRIRYKLIRIGIRTRPNLFGTQFVVTARLKP